MSLTHALSTNNYGPNAIIVSTNPANGTHVTLASAISYASSGDTIYLRNSVTENVTIDKSLTIANINLLGTAGGSGGKVSITGKITCTTNSIGIRFVGISLISNSDNILSLNATTTDVVFNDCNIAVTASTGLSLAGAGSNIYLKNCYGAASAATVLFASTNPVLWFDQCRIAAASSTTSTTSVSSVNIRDSVMSCPITTSSTGVVYAFNSVFGSTPTPYSNITWLTTAGTGISQLFNCEFYSGTASAISIGSGTTVECYNSVINSSNTNAITGAGTFKTDATAYVGSSSLNNTTTKTFTVFGEKGTWTPVLAFGGASVGITYAAQTGNYTRIGNVVTFTCDMQLTAKGSSTGLATISGLPYFPSAATIYPVSSTALTFTGSLNARQPAATAAISIDSFATGGARATLTDAAFANGTFIQTSGSFLV